MKYKLLMVCAYCLASLYSSGQKGFTVIVPSGTQQIYRLVPSESNLFDNGNSLKVFASEKWYPLPTNDNGCRKHLLELYKQIPIGGKVYYQTTVYRNPDPSFKDVISANCHFIGAGNSLVDAISTELLNTVIKVEEERNNYAREDYFVEVSREAMSSQMVIQQIVGDYDRIMSESSRLSDEKLRRLVVLPADQVTLPESIQASIFWHDITKSNSQKMKPAVLTEVKALNEQFEKVESDFRKGVELYQEYGRLNAMNDQKYALVGLMLDAASAYYTVAESNAAKQEVLNQKKFQADVLDHQKDIALELAKLKTKSEMQRSELNAISKKLLLIYRNNNIPVSDVPEIIIPAPILY